MARPAARKPARKTSRTPKLLTSFRCLDGERVTSSGFGRALKIDRSEVMLESPDAFPVGQILKLEFLLDENRLVQARGRVTRIREGKGLYRVKIALDKLPASSRRLLERQTAN
jgi:hypothetical protein